MTEERLAELDDLNRNGPFAFTMTQVGELIAEVRRLRTGLESLIYPAGISIQADVENHNARIDELLEEG